jgi:hypothetical protein
MDIGRLDGPPEEQLYGVADATRLSDGSVVVALYGSHELRRFGPDGTYLWTAGGEGGGPGEFQGLIAVRALAGDTLLTYDVRQRRLSRFAPDGAFVDAHPLETGDESAFTLVESILTDGTAVCVAQSLDFQNPPPEGTARRDTMSVILVRPGDTVPVVVGRFPGPEMAMEVRSSGQRTSITTTSPLFARGTEVAAADGAVYVGDSDRWEVRRYGLDGRLEGIVRRLTPPVDVTAEMVDRAITAEVEEAEDDEQRREIRARFGKLPVPATLPAFQNLEADPAGDLWARTYSAPGPGERIWSVFGPDGRWLGNVAFPDRFSPLEIGPDYVLGRWADPLDVEHVQVRSLVKPGD